MPNIACANNPNEVDPLVEQDWRVKRAYPVYDMQRENKAVGLGLFKSPLSEAGRGDVLPS